MEDTQLYSIGEISKMFGIPASTLRYWEEKELFSIERNHENDYRTFDIQTTIELLDIIFYRNLNVPIKKMKHFKQLSPETIFALLEDTEARAKRDLQQLQQKLHGIAGRKEQILEFFSLQKQDYQLEYPPIKKIVDLDENNPQNIQIQLSGPTTFFLVKNQFSDKHFLMGLDVSSGAISDSPVIWENDENSEKIYYTSLFETSTKDPAINNLEEHSQEFKKRGFTISSLLAQYLATGVNQENQAVDYYKAWFEVVPYHEG